jgi:Tol biopolymer transport system component
MPAWTPDGKYIAINGSLSSLASGTMTLPSTIGLSAQFSPDGQYIYFDDNGNRKNRYFSKYDRGNGEIKKLVNFPNTNYPPIPCISPNGEWLAYVIKEDSTTQLHIHNIKTKNDRVLIGSIEGHYHQFKEHYAFSADSHELFIGFNGRIHRININNGTDNVIPFKAK